MAGYAPTGLSHLVAPLSSLHLLMIQDAYGALQYRALLLDVQSDRCRRTPKHLSVIFLTGLEWQCCRTTRTWYSNQAQALPVSSAGGVPS